MPRQLLIACACCAALLSAIAMTACSRAEPVPAVDLEVADLNIEVTSPAFGQGEPIAPTYTCDGEDWSPPLKWSAAPLGTKSITLIAHDPDAPGGTWVHWVLYDIPPNVTELQVSVPAQDVLPVGAKHGVNDFKRRDYGGPCPPQGSPHRYFFNVYALDIKTEFEPGKTRADLERKMKGHILAQGRLMGTYQRK